MVRRMTYCVKGRMACCVKEGITCCVEQACWPVAPSRNTVYRLCYRTYRLPHVIPTVYRM